MSGHERLCHWFVKAVLKGCKRLDIAKVRAPKQKSLIFPEHLLALVSRFAGPSASLPDILVSHT